MNQNYIYNENQNYICNDRNEDCGIYMIEKLTVGLLK
jgi:hypothetical protein